MARYAESGAIAGTGFAVLAIVTAGCALLGWRSAVQRRFSEHRQWMWRCFLCLCSAVVLRLIGGLSIVTDVGGGWSYPLAAWVSWLVPLVAFELSGVVRRQLRGAGIFDAGHFAPSSSALSPPAMEISARR